MRLAGSIKDNSKRRFRGGGPRPDNASYKRKLAQTNQEGWNSLSPNEKLQSLDARLGKGIGAQKQRRKIAQLLKQ